MSSENILFIKTLTVPQKFPMQPEKPRDGQTEKEMVLEWKNSLEYKRKDPISAYPLVVATMTPSAPERIAVFDGGHVEKIVRVTSHSWAKWVGWDINFDIQTLALHFMEHAAVSGDGFKCGLPMLNYSNQVLDLCNIMRGPVRHRGRSYFTEEVVERMEVEEAAGPSKDICDLYMSGNHIEISKLAKAEIRDIARIFCLWVKIGMPGNPDSEAEHLYLEACKSIENYGWA